MRLTRLDRKTRPIARRVFHHGLKVPNKAEGDDLARELGKVPGLTTYRSSRRGHGPGGWETSVLVWRTKTGDPLPWLDDLRAAANGSFLSARSGFYALPTTLRVQPFDMLDTAWRLGGLNALMPLIVDPAPISARRT